MQPNKVKMLEAIFFYKISGARTSLKSATGNDFIIAAKPTRLNKLKLAKLNATKANKKRYLLSQQTHQTLKTTRYR